MHFLVWNVLLSITLDTHLAEFDSDNTLTLVRLMIQSFISSNKLNNMFHDVLESRLGYYFNSAMASMPFK